MTDIPITPQEQARFNEELETLLRLHLGDEGARGAALIAAGVAKLVDEHELEGILMAKNACVAALQGAAETLSAILASRLATKQ